MEAINTVSITVNDFAKVVQNRKDLYEAVLRNGFYLPKLKSNMITEEYLRNVISGKAFCLKHSETRNLPCPRPPHVDVLLKKFHKVCRDQKLVHQGVDKSHIPDKGWLLTFLSTLTP